MRPRKAATRPRKISFADDQLVAKTAEDAANALRSDVTNQSMVDDDWQRRSAPDFDQASVTAASTHDTETRSWEPLNQYPPARSNSGASWTPPDQWAPGTQLGEWQPLNTANADWHQHNASEQMSPKARSKAQVRKADRAAFKVAVKRDGWVLAKARSTGTGSSMSRSSSVSRGSTSAGVTGGSVSGSVSGAGLGL
jgi:hypothetical protein